MKCKKQHQISSFEQTTGWRESVFFLVPIRKSFLKSWVNMCCMLLPCSLTWASKVTTSDCLNMYTFTVVTVNSHEYHKVQSRDWDFFFSVEWNMKYLDLLHVPSHWHCTQHDRPHAYKEPATSFTPQVKPSLINQYPSGNRWSLWTCVLVCVCVDVRVLCDCGESWNCCDPCGLTDGCIDKSVSFNNSKWQLLNIYPPSQNCHSSFTWVVVDTDELPCSPWLSNFPIKH